MFEARHERFYQRRQWESACACAEAADDFPPRRPWTEDDEAFLRRNYDRNGNVWCAVRLNRTPEAVRWHMMALRARDDLSAFARQYLGTLSLRA